MAFTFDNWVKFTATHAGRDKIFRFAQYASKLAAAQLKGDAPVPKAVAAVAGSVKTVVTLTPTLELAGQLSRLSSALSLARKLFRAGKFVEGIQKAYVAIAGLSAAKLTLAQFISIAKNLTTGLYLFYDTLQWISDSGVRKSQFAQQIKDRRNAFYAASIFFSFAEAFLKLRKNLRALAKEEQASTNLDATIASRARTEVAKLQRENSDLFLELAKNAVDFPLPLASLKYFDLSDRTVGLAGTFTSAIALKLTWAKETASKAK